EQAKEQMKIIIISENKNPITEKISKQNEQLHIERLGLEQTNVTYEAYKRYEEVFQTKLVPVSNVIESLRLIKTEEELTILKEAAKIADQTFEHILTFIKPGVKEIDIANALEFTMRQAGATSSSFDIIVASGYRTALPHGVASNKEIVTGELVTMDFGALYKGYCSDFTRTVAGGEISDELSTIYQIILEAEKRGVEGI